MFRSELKAWGFSLLAFAVNAGAAIANYRLGQFWLFGVGVFFCGYSVGVISSHYLRRRFERREREKITAEIQETLRRCDEQFLARMQIILDVKERER